MQTIDQEGKTVEEALEEALEQLQKTEEEVDWEIIEEGSKGILGMGAKPVLIRVSAKVPGELKEAKDLLNTIFEKLQIDAKVDSDIDDKIITLNIDSVDSGILIGRHGQTLEALQYIMNQVLLFDGYKVVLDISDYRRRHKERLVQIAQKVARQVRSSRSRVTMRPMTASERKIVHEAIQGYGDLTSSSIGSEPNRRVVISSIRREFRRYGGGRSRGGDGDYSGSGRPQGNDRYQGNRYRNDRNDRYQGDRYRNDRNDRYQGDRYRNDRYSDNRYQNDRNDRYQGDRYRNDRYSDNRYQNDRYKDDKYKEENPLLNKQNDRYQEDNPLDKPSDRYQEDNSFDRQDDRYQEDNSFNRQDDGYREENPLDRQSDKYQEDNSFDDSEDDRYQEENPLDSQDDIPESKIDTSDEQLETENQKDVLPESVNDKSVENSSLLEEDEEKTEDKDNI